MKNSAYKQNNLYITLLTTASIFLLACGGGSSSDPIPLASGATVTTLAGTALMSGSTDATGAAARFNFPRGMATDGTNIYVADTTNHTIRQIVIATGVVTTLAGTALMSGSTDDIGTAARFNFPRSVAIDGANLYVADTNSHTIRKIVIASGVVTTLAGTALMSGSTDATGAAARFFVPRGITTDGTNLYLTDTNNHTIRQIVIATGVVTTLAGTAGMAGSTDATGTAARFNAPWGSIVVGANLYIVDASNHIIRQIVIATGAVTTFAGTVNMTGSVDGTGAAARFDNPRNIATDGTNLYVTDSGTHIIRKIVIATGEVTTLAGTADMNGSSDGTGAAARFNIPFGITADSTSVYVADTDNHTIRQIK